jgi:alkanesulfonate monooxygenase SsuD/methylene tetrahydromethanopterin reductase-like flavin-dependent oxidoreductase (luciferase family)
LLADMARTIDHLGDGRFILGLGAGWYERDYDEYEYEFGTPATRLAGLAASLPKIMQRFDSLNPPPISIPILIGGSGEKVTLRLVAEHADAWNSFGPPEQYAAKQQVLDGWCAKVGRDPNQIERTVAIQPHELDAVDRYLEAGASHLIVMVGAPFDLAPVEQLLELARA